MGTASSATFSAPSNLTPGANSQGVVNFACYDIDGIKPINCTVTASLSALDPAFGGHVNHTAAQPLGTITDPNSPGQGGTFLIGSTLNGFTVVYKAPEASGRVEFDTSWTFPRGYVCLDNGRQTCSFTDHLEVAIELQPLDPDASLFILTGATTPHPLNHFGTADAVTRLRMIAQKYKKDTQKKLSINDMSLPNGGLFDLCSTWNPADKCPPAAPNGGHSTHRAGTDADIDQQGTPCLKDDEFLEAVLAAGATRQCESGGRKHVDFD